MRGDEDERQKKTIVHRKGTGKSARFGEILDDANGQMPRELGWLLVLLFVILIFSKARRAPDEIKNPRSVPSRPPINAEYLLYLTLRKEERDAVIGDLNEEYGYVLNRFGRPRAELWFYKQVVSSMWPFLRRAVVKIATLVWLGRLLKRLVS